MVNKSEHFAQISTPEKQSEKAVQRFACVLLPLPFDKPFTYKIIDEIEIGNLVKVSLCFILSF